MRSLVGAIHGQLVFGRRIRAIADFVAASLQPGDRVLDIGCGSGDLSALLMQKIGGVKCSGVDTLVRPETRIPVEPYDGKSLPIPDKSFDAVIIVDVLHHAEDANAVVAEAARVAKRCVIIKDHVRTGTLSQWTLSFMDWVGNAPHGVVCTYNYFSMPEWNAIFAAAGLTLASQTRKIGLYPFPASLLFERDYHIGAVLTPQ
jgi:SAM-dependent methyltransferase